MFGSIQGSDHEQVNLQFMECALKSQPVEIKSSIETPPTCFNILQDLIFPFEVYTTI